MRSRVVFVTSHPMSAVAFMLPHIKALNALEPVQVFANSKESTLLQQRGVDVPVNFMPIERPIAPWFDFQALWLLFWRFKNGRPQAVHTFTPKAGLLGMLAAWLARVPVRVHSFTGQVWVTRAGLTRWLFKAADKCIAAMATDVLVDSPSQRDFLVSEGIVTSRRSIVLGFGSISGVDIERFSPNKKVRKVVRRQLETADDAIVCLYLGRLNRDKGVLDIANAFAQIAHKHPKAELWVVGPDEGDYFERMMSLMGNSISRVKRVDFTLVPERFMQAADLFCLPSYREGFGSSVIEAAACGVPTLASRIYGITDALMEGKTGWMHRACDVQDLAQQLDRLLLNPDEIVARGRNAREYVKAYFREDIVTDAMLEFYKRRLK